MDNAARPNADTRAHAPRPVYPDAGVVADLTAELARTTEAEVRFSDGDRALYATDGSNYRQVPIGVVVPRTTGDVVATVAACRARGLPLLSRGGGTSLAGQCCNAAVVVDFSKYLNRVVDVDPGRRLARVEPGTILDDLRAAAERHHLTFGPDPATHNHCTLGGMVGNNSCGVHAQMAGRTADNVRELEILTYDGLRLRVGATSDLERARIIREGGRRGEIYRRLTALRDKYADAIRHGFPPIPRRVSGYNLDELLPEKGFQVARALVGTEGTCVTVLEVVGELVPSPPARALLVLGYPDVYHAADDVMEILPYKPLGLEGLDERLYKNIEKKGLHTPYLKFLPPGGGWLYVEFGGETVAEARAAAARLMRKLGRRRKPPAMRLYTDAAVTTKVWKIRESGLGATARVPGERDTWPGWEDSAVPPAAAGAYLRELRALFDKFGYDCALYGHFGQGCIHTRIDFDLKTADGIATYMRFMDEATSLCLSYGGSLSGEHGDGQSRAAYLEKMYGPELMQAFRDFKAIWDPEGRMNPGKVVDAYGNDENLRLGTQYEAAEPATTFRFPDDDGSFARATLRCVGVGKCRRLEAEGTMCPSFQVTREEKHSTRGRAHLLFEMLRGDALHDGFADEAVHEALDLCLACKGCKHDCPVNVDMATYKAEFLAHHYATHRRPLSAYAFGWIFRWARLAQYLPWLVNPLAKAPGISAAAKRLVGVAQARSVPPFAREPFKIWWRRRRSRVTEGREVVLWADTFNNHWHPDTLAAAAEVLEAAGCSVRVPAQPLCCGRPLYDYGMLDLAKRKLDEIMTALAEPIRRGVPIVVLEPSCASVFRDELPGLFPNREDADRLRRNVYTFSEYLQKFAPDLEIPKLKRPAVLHGHCHHKAVLDFGAEIDLLARTGLDVETLESGCCGMAGAFGFEADKYDVSIACGERVLLPKVRAAGDAAVVVASGFSCREQVMQTTDRRPLHIAQVVKLCFDAAQGLRLDGRPEDGRFSIAEHGRLPAASVAAAAALAAGAGLAGAIAWRRLRGGA